MITYVLFLLMIHISIHGYEPLTERTYTTLIPHNIECYIGADIGGTHTDFGIFEIKNSIPTLLFSLHTKTQTITNFTAVINDVLSYAQSAYAINIQHACIATPGVASENKDYAVMHDLFVIESKDIIQKTNLKTVLIVNDFFVIGHGINFIDQSKIVKIHGNTPQEHGIRAIIGAGTGLGSSLMIWNEKKQQYVTYPGEAGLIEFAPQSQFEYDLANHIKHMNGRTAIYWDHFVSGTGIIRMYSMLKLTHIFHDSMHLDVHDPAIIFTHPEDALCAATINTFFNLYARFARNYVFTTLPLGGLYIAGGIVAKNAPLFSSLFIPEYLNCPPCLQEILQSIPIYLITDYNVSLYGAMHYLLLEKNRSQPIKRNKKFQDTRRRKIKKIKSEVNALKQNKKDEKYT
jgi:glucokinase